MKVALLVIDMQNSFLHSEGENFIAPPAALVDNCLALIDAARRNGIPIVHSVDCHRRNFADFEQNRLPQHCLEGGFNAEYFQGFGPAGHANEIEISKRRYSAFFATDLAIFLYEQAIARVVICGVKTNVCVRATAQDAFAYGFDPWVAGDATASNREALAQASLEDIDRYMGGVVPTLEAARLFE